MRVRVWMLGTAAWHAEAAGAGRHGIRIRRVVHVRLAGPGPDVHVGVGHTLRARRASVPPISSSDSASSASAGATGAPPVMARLPVFAEATSA